MNKEKYCVCVQRNFRLCQAQRIINVLKFDKDITKKHKFEHFTEMIRSKNVLSMINFVLTKINRIVNYVDDKKPLTSQEFLSSFVIYGYENEIIDKNQGIIISNNNLDTIMIKIATEIVEKFSNLNNNISLCKIRSFNRSLILYKQIFNLWKTHDIKRLVHILTTSYYELESIITLIEEKNSTNSEDIEYIILCKQRQEDFIDKIIFLSGQEYFNNYKHQEVTLDEKLQIHIKETMYDAFWEMLLRDLSSENPEYGQLLSLITEVRDTLCNFVPNRPDVQAENT